MSAGALLLAAASAQATATFDFEFGASGSGAGQFAAPSDIAVNQANGDIYITDRTQNRVSKFNAAGEFQLMWGRDVFGINEQQQLTVSATGGTYTLEFEGNTTEPIARNATGATVAEALALLPSIGANNVSGSGSGAGTKTITFKGALGGTDVSPLVPDSTNLTGGTATAEVTTIVDGAGGPGEGFEICEEPSLCSAGIAGSESGAMSSPQGIGVYRDPGTGDVAVYVQDAGNERVQKFDGDGNFLLMWGKEVNETTGGRICTAESGDTCKTGVISGNPSTGEPSELGAFYAWYQGFPPNPGSVSETRAALAVDSEGYVYVGECCSIRTGIPPEEWPDARVQKFDSSGIFVGVLSPRDTGGYELGEPHSLAVDASGRLYLHDEAYNSGAQGIIRYRASQFTPTISEPIPDTFWGQTGFFSGEFPISIEPSSQFVIVIENGCSILPGPGATRIVEYTPAAGEIDCTKPENLPESTQVKATAISSAHKLSVLIDGSPDRVMVFNLPSASAPEVVGEPQAREITSEKAVIRDEISANLGETTFHIEYGTEPCSGGECQSTAESGSIGAAAAPRQVSDAIEGLQANTKYYYRVVATNSAGSDTGAEGVFRTFAVPSYVASCPNSLARQQTQAALLLDCRAYELVSPEEQGGYDVESDTVPGQQPFGGYPLAGDRALFGMHNGGIPGVGKPTNRGIDPYVATRDEANQRWSTEYVGVPADAPSEEPFSSTLAGADSGLDKFAFGGEDICDPCFEDGSAGMPLRPGTSGPLEQGMAGSIEVADPEPAGVVKKHFSSDGTHFIFGSDQRFEPLGNDENGNVTIYDRNLEAGTTQVASTTPGGEAVQAGEEVTALDVSKDGSRVLIGVPIEPESDYYDLYMHVGTSTNSVPIVTGGEGARYAGMTSDGSEVFFATREELVSDGDESVDLFAAEIGNGGIEGIERISTGSEGAGNSDGCTPVVDWNTTSGSGKCDVVTFGGGSGVASDSGTVYFLSPELLDGAGNGEAGQANLYVSEPGAATPDLVEVIDSSAVKPPPLPPIHELEDESFITGLTNPVSIAIDQSNGEIFVAERVVNRVSRFTPEGAPSEFSSLASNQLTGQNLGGNGEGQIAIDSAAGSPFQGSLYVTTNGGAVRVYANNGEKLGELTGFGEACGVSVDQSNGDVYVGNYSNRVYRFKPISAAAPVTNASYEPKEEITAPDGLCNIDANGPDYVYTWPYNGGNVKQYPKSAFAVGGSSPAGTVVGNGRHSQTDPENGDLFVNGTTQITRYDSSGSMIEQFGSGILSNSRGVAIDQTSKAVYATSGVNIAKFGEVTPPYEPIDNPAVLHGVNPAGVESFSDFQVSPDGRFAAFSSVMPITEFESDGKYEVFRYDASGPSIDCISCNPTLQKPGTDARLASDGLSLLEDGRVFFTSGEPLTLRDTNQRRDVYEWEEGAQELISSGQDRSDSSLLTVSEDGIDAFFFTRETLAKNDHNGTLMKLYDARENGGFFVVPPPPACAASDECHGPGSQSAPPATFGTLEGSGGNVKAAGCGVSQLSRRTKRLSRQADALRRRAGKSSGKRAAALRRQARRKARAAKRSANATRRCRRRMRSAR